MILVCIFVPFLHEETPKPVNVQKVPFNKDYENNVTQRISQIFEMRMKISDVQHKKKKLGATIL